MESLHPMERKVVLVCDEMKIQEGLSHDANLGKSLGDVTLPGHSGVADHACTWMIGSISGHWKQQIAYHFTPDSVDGNAFAEVINSFCFMNSKRTKVFATL